MLLRFSILLMAPSISLARTDASNISPDELLAGTAFGVEAESMKIVSHDDVMALSDEMREFLDTHVSQRAQDPVKLRQLSDAVFDKATFGLEYNENTRTAADTFKNRSGNCLSFTFMFVVLARGVGLKANFQEVEIPPAWSFTEDTYILNRHINIHVDLGRLPPKIVDFDIADFRADYDMRIIPDERALAHFFNNVGAEHMQRGDVAAAFSAFREAIVDHDRNFAPAWDSLGTLYYGRQGLSDHAEAAFLHALEIDRSDLTAMNNLTVLYDRRGEPGLAESYRKKVRKHREHNPYYRFHRARIAYQAQDYDLALHHLKYALRKHRDDDRFCALLALVYLKMGDEKKSRLWMDRATEYATNDAMKRIYSSKIDRLIAASR
jgi:Flp pilus assembly protein TadD